MSKEEWNRMNEKNKIKKGEYCPFLIEERAYEPTDDGMGEEFTGYDYECIYDSGNMDFDPSRDCPYPELKCPIKDVFEEVEQK